MLALQRNTFKLSCSRTVYVVLEKSRTLQDLPNEVALLLLDTEKLLCVVRTYVCM